MSIKAWSFSRLVVFEQCPLRAKLAYVDKIQELERALPPGKTEHANDRGTRIHEAAELFVKSDVELLPELQVFSAELQHLRAAYKAGKVSLEGEWAFDKEWVPTAWSSSSVWLRMKLDVMMHITPVHAVVIDYKTGKKSGNEIKHAEQGQLYQLGAFLRHPELEKITVELWYIDQDEITRVDYTRSQGLRFLANYTKRGQAMTNVEDYAPKPNMFNCKWCPYSEKGTGHCDKGVFMVAAPSKYKAHHGKD